MDATGASEDPVQLLQAAARFHLPVNPTEKDEENITMPVPESRDRESINEIISSIESSKWYKGQITSRRTFEEKEPQIGPCKSLFSVLASNTSPLVRNAEIPSFS